VEALRVNAEQAVDAIKAAPHEFLGPHTVESDKRIGTAYSSRTVLIGVSAEDGMTTPKTDIGKDPSHYKIARSGYLAYNPMRVNIGSIGVLRDGTEQAITSPDYVVFYCKPTLLPEYVYHYLKSEAGRHEINLKTKGSVRFRLYYEQFSKIKIPVPANIQDQQRFVDACNQLEALKRNVAAATESVQSCLNVLTRSALISNGT
jgi:Type I restriction modification DNA specificity domain